MHLGDLDVYYKSYNVLSLKDKFNDGSLIFSPGFVIDESRQSEYIESILLNAITNEIVGITRYVGNPHRCVYEIHDGRKRLSAIIRFVNDEFALNWLTVMTAYEGKKFSQLHPAIMSAINDTSFKLILLSSTNNKKDVTDEAIKRFL